MSRCVLFRARAWRPGVLVLCVFLVIPHGAWAQQCTEEPCAPVDITPPTVSISPGTSTYTGGSPTVTISWSDNLMLDHVRRVIRYGGVDVTSNFSYTTTNNWSAQSVGTITVGPGSQLLEATICDSEGNCRTATVTYTGPAPSVRVTPEVLAVSVPGGIAAITRYRVVNTGTVQTTFAVAMNCTYGFWNCHAGTTSVTLPGGDSAWVDASFVTPGSGSGTISVTASTTGVSATASTSVTALAVADPGFPGDDRSLQRIQRDACVTIAMGPAAASECGDLRVVHELPEVRLLNKVRAPMLTYNSDHARPIPIVAAHQAGPAAGMPDSIRAVLRVNGVQVAQRRWRGWGAAETRRLAIAFDASSPSTYPTGIYTYTLEVIAEWLTGTQQVLSSRTGRMIIVNRSASPFGAGWWLSGVEQLIPIPGDTAKLWVGGDGSARIYRGSPGGPWVADSYDRPDILIRRTTELGEVLVRTLSGRSEVWFDAFGHHVRTVNPLQQYTAFRWNGSYLTQINLPYSTAQGDTTRYLFEYDNNAGATVRNLSRVVAPGIGAPRHTWLTTDATGRVTRITDFDSTYVGFGYSGATKWMSVRTDRRGAPQTFGYQGVRFFSSTRPVSPTLSAVTRVLPVLGQGYSYTVSLDSVRAVYDGPRTDLCDCMWWHTDRFGAPIDSRNALQQLTLIRRGDPRWPAHITEVVAPNGFSTTATYDDRGNVASTTAWNPYGDNRDATTTYRWDSYWDQPLQVVAPEGEVSLTGYDTFGRRSWDQVGPSASRRVNYRYYAQTDAQAPGLLRAVTSPVLHTDSVAYDARGNTALTVSPMGFRSYSDNDALGRVVRTRSPIDSLQTSFRVDSTGYDRSGRPWRTESFGRAANGAVDQRLIVETEYDSEGLVRQVSRWSVPDTAHVGTIITRFAYDTLGRQVAETAPDGWADSTFYDLGGNLVRTRDRRGNVVETGYDHLNRPLWTRTPTVFYSDTASRGWTFPRYPNCQTTGLCLAADTSWFGYDTQGNLLRADNHDAQVRRTYYRGGALQTDTLRIRTWAELDAGGSITAHEYGLRYGYDRNGRRSWIKIPRQLGAKFSTAPSVVHDSVAYAYDPLTGAISSVSDVLGNTFGFTYNLDGSPHRVLYPRGHFKQYTYDPDGRTTRIREDTTATGGSVNDITLRYDARGKAVEITPFSTGGYGPDHNGYSGLGALVSHDQQRPYYSALGPRTDWEVWTVDALGNVASTGGSYAFKEPTTFGIQNYNGSSMTWNAFQPATGRLLLVRTHSGSSNTPEESGCSSSQGDSTVRVNRFDRAGNIQFTTAAWRHQASGTCYGYWFDEYQRAWPTRTDSYGSDSAHVHSARYYDANARLRVVDARMQGNGRLGLSADPPGYEEYRYDALGRRILRRARHTGTNGMPADSALLDLVQRFIWDGDHLVAEIQAPGGNSVSTAVLEGDTIPPSSDGEWYGRVLYLAGEGIDRPISIIRIGYGKTAGGVYRAWQPIAITPRWDYQGRGYGLAVYGPTAQCQPAGSGSACLTIQWPAVLASGKLSSHSFAQYAYNGWFGSLVQDQLDGTGQYYRRNRYYDPATGRFTQEDPIGLAGGLNAYGFAGGDPVNYVDPFGLSPEQVGCPRCAVLIARGLRFLRGLGRTSVIANRRGTGADIFARGTRAFADASRAVNANSAHLPQREVLNFRNAEYAPEIYGPGTVLYGVRDANSSSRWWLPSIPTSRARWRNDAAVKVDWNQGTHVETMIVPPGQYIIGFRGAAERQGPFSGGGQQIFIGDVPSTWITRAPAPWTTP